MFWHGKSRNDGNRAPAQGTCEQARLLRLGYAHTSPRNYIFFPRKTVELDVILEVLLASTSPTTKALWPAYVHAADTTSFLKAGLDTSYTTFDPPNAAWEPCSMLATWTRQLYHVFRLGCPDLVPDEIILRFLNTLDFELANRTQHLAELLGTITEFSGRAVAILDAQATVPPKERSTQLVLKKTKEV